MYQIGNIIIDSATSPDYHSIEYVIDINVSVWIQDYHYSYDINLHVYEMYTDFFQEEL